MFDVRKGVPVSLLAFLDTIWPFSPYDALGCVSRIAVGVLQLPPSLTWRNDEMYWIFITKDGKSILIFTLPYLAVCSKIPASWTVTDEIVLL